jgi:formate/nitrite transporter FocA (FNT family)
MTEERDLHDAYPPSEIAQNVEHLGVAKAHTDTLTLLVLAVNASNMIGGKLLVAGVYWFAYLRGDRRPTS